MSTRNVASRWRASYRLQLHKDFGFADAAAQIDYLRDLGISHLYLSPILTARQGSRHGYDGVDPSTINPELGGEEGFRALVAAARQAGLGVVIDIVPNHLAIGHADNARWLETLEWGRKGRAARFFDIDWDANDIELRGKVLLPLLGDHFGAALERGEIALEFDATSRRLQFAHYDHRFPLAAGLYAALLRGAGEELKAFAENFRSAKTPAALDEAKQALATFASSQPGAAAIKALLAGYRSDTPEGRARLERLLARQHYRLAHWRTATDEINWRRFFDVTTLAGVRVELPCVFEAMHARIFALYAEGLIDGVRVDHVDGLAEPEAYCRQLRTRLSRLEKQRPPVAPKGAAYVVVEKILASEERLPADWPVQGTTGYSFMNEVGALLHDPAGEAPLTAFWREATGTRGDFETELRASRRRIPQQLLAADFNACAHAFHQLARADVATRDWPLAAMQRALTEILVELPVYRTYVDHRRGCGAEDADLLRTTFARAAERMRPSERPLLQVIEGWLVEGARGRRGARSARWQRAVARFQQLSSPVAAKAVEDTAFYRFGPLLSRNEVGADPRQFSMTREAFLAEGERRAARYPLAMLATATHDHKRGEDARMRLAALSEDPEPWLRQLARWRERHAPDTAEGPDAGDGIMLYQTLFAAWPGTADLGTFAERVKGWQTKSLREAKRHSAWLEPNEPYEAACHVFLERLLVGDRAAPFVQEMGELVAHYADAARSRSLAQTLLKLTMPGLPDFYQGCESWDYSLVDPDNRRPVDYAALRVGLVAAADDDSRKQHLVQAVLGARAECPELFTDGALLPLAPAGGDDSRLAFARHWRDRAAIVVVPLRGLSSASAPIHLELPEPLQAMRWRKIVGHAAAASSTLPLTLPGDSPASLWLGSNRPA